MQGWWVTIVVGLAVLAACVFGVLALSIVRLNRFEAVRPEKGRSLDVI